MPVFDLGRDQRSDGCGHRSPLGAGGQAAVQGWPREWADV